MAEKSSTHPHRPPEEALTKIPLDSFVGDASDTARLTDTTAPLATDVTESSECNTAEERSTKPDSKTQTLKRESEPSQSVALEFEKSDLKTETEEADTEELIRSKLEDTKSHEASELKTEVESKDKQEIEETAERYSSTENGVDADGSETENGVENGTENMIEAVKATDKGTELPPVPEKEVYLRATQELRANQFNAKLENVQIFQKAFSDITDSKEVKKKETLRAAVQSALDSISKSDSSEVQVIFETLKVLCDQGSQDLKSKAVDVLAKLFDYSVFEDDLERATLTDAAIDVISSCFEGEGTDEKLEVQVVRALVQSILCMPTHGASLLKAVRQIFNVTIMSLSQDNQGLAQGSLTQVVGAIFQRVNESAQRNKHIPLDSLSAVTTAEVDVDVLLETVHEKLTLETLRNLAADSADVERANEASYASAKDEDLAVKDAFLIFRVICKLASKDLDSDTVDMKSHAARQKVLTIHLIHTILKDNIDIFLSRDVVLLSTKSDKNTRLVDAIRPSLSQALSRNATSSLAPVFELSIEIFWLLVANLRLDFKKEISIFFETIYFPIGEIKTSTPHHKRYLLSVMERLCNDSRCLIEFYLNYDCLSKMPDICDMLINYLTKLALARVEVTPTQQQAFRERRRQGIAIYDVSKIGELNSARIASRPPEPDVYAFFPLEYALKITSLSCFVAFLRSLHSWTQKGLYGGKTKTIGPVNLSSALSHDNSRNTSFNATLSSRGEDNNDYEQFESQRQRKRLFAEGVRRFTQKPHKAIQFFYENGFLRSESVEDVASFLRDNDTLDKASIGEYISGEKDGALRQAFFSRSNFAGLSFVDALRSFLQLFRLPGEGQKVDRFMLNFAERYVEGNPGVFETANAAYYLAYLTTMLNTDQHSRSLKSRMTLEDFIRMNEGCEDSLSRELSEEIFNEVHSHEIKLLSEQSAAAIMNDGAGTTASVGFFSGRDVTREAYNHASREMSSKTEMLVRSLGKKTRSGDDEDYHVALNVVHVKAIINQVWMSVLAGITGPLKEYNDEEAVRLCLEGLKFSIKMACIFDMEDAKKAFVNALVQFQSLSNIEDLRAKNVSAIYVLLDLAVSEGNFLHNLWYTVLALILQLERLQLIANGIDQDLIPDVSTARLVTKMSTEGVTSRSSGFFGFSRETSAAESAALRHQKQHLSQDLAQLLGATELSVAMDRVYTNTSELSGEAIKDFVSALRQVVEEEIESLGSSNNPRLFSLQKVVDICYYNMGRVRFEWSPLWAILGDIFNTVGCHPNLAIDFFALDSLKQLSMRFLSLEELAHFKFQKEFLQPFLYIIVNNRSFEVKEMVIDCVSNMVLAKANQIKSGWKTIFEVLTAAAGERSDNIVKKAFETAVRIRNDNMTAVRLQDLFGDLVACFTKFAKNERFQKYGLSSVDILTKLLVQEAQLEIDTVDSTARIDKLTRLWFPVLSAFHDIIMQGEELEVRLKTITRFFDVLNRYGTHFAPEFWLVIYRQLISPMFEIISQPWGLACGDSLSETDRMSFWVSTTLVQALNNMVSLATHYFDAFEPLLPDFLALLTNCICQENDTIAKTGKKCLEGYILSNALRLSDAQWGQIVDTFANLFELTTAKDLLEGDTKTAQKQTKNNDSKAENEASGETVIQTSANAAAKEVQNKARDKATMVLKCILQLLLIETVLDLTKKEAFTVSIPDFELIRLSQLLFSSHDFARRFNDNYELRKRLWDAGIIERLPTLLKQETIAAAVFLNIMFRLYCDDSRATDLATKKTILDNVVPLCTTIVARYCAYNEASQQTYILAWNLVIKEIFEGYVEMDDSDFRAHAPDLFRLAIQANNRSSHPEVQRAIAALIARVGEVFVYTS